jgi:uridylate kinase
MRIVISIGGSLLTRELTPENFRGYANAVLELWKKGHKLIVVCGGGKTCRYYMDIAKDLGGDRDLLDFVGIMATHINASTFSAGLGKLGYWVKWKNKKEAVKEIKKVFGKKIVVCGGYDPETSTGYDAALFAEIVKADLLIKATNKDGVYSEDPKNNPNAKKFDKLTHDEFLKIIEKNPQLPGEYRLFDLAGTRILKKLKLKTIIIDGTDPEEIIRAAEDKHHGTVIS